MEIAENGMEGVRKYKNGSFDILLMDIQMPVMDGHSATLEIRDWEKEKNMQQVPIIALTAHARKPDIQESLNAGCSRHISKPVRKKILLKAIHGLAFNKPQETNY